jgi:hypothetical protein
MLQLLYLHGKSSQHVVIDPTARMNVEANKSYKTEFI